MPRPLSDLVSFFQIHPEPHVIWPFQPFLPFAQPQNFDKLRRLITNMAVFTRNPFPLEYSPKIQVVPCDPDRLPYVPVQILYLIAQALPQPSQVFNLARVNKETWDYLQPALYECEVTYEARLVALFGICRRETWRGHPPHFDNVRIDGTNGDHGDSENDDQFKAKCGRKCAHGLVTSLCEVCGKRIAIEEKHFRNSFAINSARDAWSGEFSDHVWDGKTSPPQDFFESRSMTALHWACRHGEKALPVARKAIEAAKVHQPSYIDGRGLRMRSVGGPPRGTGPRFGEIPPPLFTAAAFGNTKLCKELIEAGCSVNLLQSKDFRSSPHDSSVNPHFRIHESCVRDPDNQRFWQCGSSAYSMPTCQTAGHVAMDSEAIDALKFLMDHGLDPVIGGEPLIHRAARRCDLPAVKAILDRFPEMASYCWNDLTPLHILCTPSIKTSKDTRSLEELKSVASYLVQKGAYLEAQSGMRLTPLQHSLIDTVSVPVAIDSDTYYASEALIMLGAIWNQFLDEHVITFLDHCVGKAALGWLVRVPPVGREWGFGYIGAKRSTENSLMYARLVKAMIRNKDSPTARGGEPPMQAFLGAFKKLVALNRGEEDVNGLDPFAVEAVGRLLLSTGISPDQSDIDKWKALIAGNVEGRGAADWAASPLRELISDLLEKVDGD